MVTEWGAKKLEELVSSPITYGVVKPGDHDNNGVKLIRGGDISRGKISNNLRTIEEKLSKQYKRTILQGGELLVSLVGNPGEVALVPEELIGANLARQVGLVRLKKEIDSIFTLYYLMSNSGIEQIKSKIILALRSKPPFSKTFHSLTARLQQISNNCRKLSPVYGRVAKYPHKGGQDR